MKLKIALVGLAHFLMQSSQAQQSVDAKQTSTDNSKIESAKKSQETLPEFFEKNLRDSKGGAVIAAPSHETSSGTDGVGREKS